MLRVNWLLRDIIFQGLKVICPMPHSELVTKAVSWSVIAPVSPGHGFRLPVPSPWTVTEGWLEMRQVNL